jgi:hypothetical protein
MPLAATLLLLGVCCALPYNHDVLTSLPVSAYVPTLLTVLDYSERLIHVYYGTDVGDVDA